jgi:hypothetical protein
MGGYQDQPLGYLLYRAMTVLRPQITAELGPLGLGLAEFVCLRILFTLPGQSGADLARHTNVSPQAMNLVLRKPARHGRDNTAGNGVVGPGAARLAYEQREGAVEARRSSRARCGRPTSEPPHARRAPRIQAASPGGGPASRRCPHGFSATLELKIAAGSGGD